jgi:RNA polymerase sigma factor (sigma-70 family)
MEPVRRFPDTEIIENLQAGKRLDETIKAIYRGSFDTLACYITANNGSEQDAEDIFQEVLVAFIELVQKGKFRGDSSIRTFLYSMNRHAWLNELKKRGRAAAREDKFGKEQAQVEHDSSIAMADREAKAGITGLMTALGETCKKILLLFYFENRSMKEIVGLTDYENEQVVRNKKYKCLKALEKMIDEKPELKLVLKNLLHG